MKTTKDQKLKKALDGKQSIKNACLFSQQGQGQRCRDANMHTHKGTRHKGQAGEDTPHRGTGQYRTERDKGVFCSFVLVHVLLGRCGQPWERMTTTKATMVRGGDRGCGSMEPPSSVPPSKAAMPCVTTHVACFVGRVIGQMASYIEMYMGVRAISIDRQPHCPTGTE